MSASTTASGTQRANRLTLRAPFRAWFAGAALGSGGALLPYAIPGLVAPWEATRGVLAASAFAALVAHALLHLVVPREESAWPRFAAATLAPGAIVAALALAVYAAFPDLRACAYAALVANASGSALDLWEAMELGRLRPRIVREVEGRVECEVEDAPPEP